MAEYNMGAFRFKPVGMFDINRVYKYFDMVTYEGSSYINIYNDKNDSDSCVGILPTGTPESETYWSAIALKGDKGDYANAYSDFTVIRNNDSWNFEFGDKVFIASDFNNQLQINNVKDGSCGMIITRNKNLKLPDNSDYSVDFNYVEARSDQYYMYTFVYISIGDDDYFNNRFIWNRTVINNA